MTYGVKIFLIASVIGAFQTVSSAGLTKEATFKILDGESIEFVYQVALIDFSGKFVVDNSYFQIDFERPEASKFQLHFDVNQSTAGFPLATKLMLSESVLYAKENKKISFISNNITRLKNRFKITGMLTIRGISKKFELEAKLNIMNENNFENTSFLNFHIFANIFRSDYGASGYSGLVGDKIVLNSNITLRPDHRELK